MKATVLLVLLVFISLACAQTPYPFSYSVNFPGVDLAYNYTANWAISPDNTTITFDVTLVFTSFVWVGIGWQSNSSTSVQMTNGDFAVALFDPAGSGQLLNIQDYYCACPTGGSHPSTDTSVGGQNNITFPSGSQFIDANGNYITNFQFSKALETGDQYDNPLVLGQENTFLFAFGSSNTFGIHQAAIGIPGIPISTTSAPIIAPTAKDYTPYKYWHGTLMVVAFGFCLSLGIFLPRYLKSFWWWFPLHIALQVLGVFLSIIAFILALIFATGNHFSTVHAYFGLATLALAFLSPILGTVSHFMWNPNRSKIPIFPDQVHWWIGRICVLLSWIAIFLGLNLIAPYEMLVGFGVVVATYLLTYIWLDITRIREIGVRAYLLGTESHHGFEEINPGKYMD